MSHAPPARPVRNGFTLIELLVAIAILAILAGLTLKGVRKFREAGWATDTQNQLMTIQNAIQTYYSTFNAYPGPIPNRTVGATGANNAYGITFPQVENDVSPTQFDISGPSTLVRLTGSENLVLGLLGGIKYDANIPAIIYDPGLIGQGPSSLNTLAPKKHGAFLDSQANLSWRTNADKKTGKYLDDVAQADDTIVPEFVDRFPQGMPILYLRSDRGAAAVTNPTSETNNVISLDTNDDPATHVAPYHLKHIRGYTQANGGAYIGENKKPIDGNSKHGLNTVTVVNMNPPAGSPKSLDGPGPFDNAYPYFVNTAVSSAGTGTIGTGDVVRKKDEYILISPGIDRIYGTKDDITNFGSVGD